MSGVRWEKTAGQEMAALSGGEAWQGGEVHCGTASAARRWELLGGELATLWQANMAQVCDEAMSPPAWVAAGG